MTNNPKDRPKVTRESVSEEFDKNIAILYREELLTAVMGRNPDPNKLEGIIKSFYDDQIQELLRQLVPEEKDEFAFDEKMSSKYYYEAIYHNLCLQEIKQRIQEAGYEIL